MSSNKVIAGRSRYSVESADCLSWLAGLPAGLVDLCFFSPPYEAARSYGINFNLRGQDWVDWMVKVFDGCRRVCKGLVACVCEGQTRGYRWSATPVLLMADLHRAGHCLRKPPAFARVGIPGSGGPDWLRNDYEFIVCTTPKGQLPWSENTACGHSPKWAPGGAMSNRHADGQRKNARASARCKARMSDPWGKRGRGNNLGGRRRDGSKKLGTLAGRDEFGFTPHDGEPSPAERANGKRRRAPRGRKNGDTVEADHYSVPAVANPGNVIRCKVGGGLMGHQLAHENEAPFPLALADFFVQSFCPPDGIVLDCFTGSGTTLHAAILSGRRFVGCDVRQGQVDIALRRAESVTPMMVG